MFKSSNLILNLNEIMEDYTEGGEEVILTTPSGTGQEREKAETRIEDEQQIEETRKRKRGAGEAEAEQKEGKTSDWV